MDLFRIQQTWPAGLLMVLLGIGALFCVLRFPGTGFWASTFFILLAPTSSFLPIVTEVGAERRMYLPLLSLIALTVIGVCKMTMAPRIIAVASLCLAIVLGGVTWQRNEMYKDEESIWADCIAKLPHNFRPYYNLGEHLIGQEDFEGAEAQFRLALAKLLDDRFDYRPLAKSRLATVLAQQEHLEEAVELSHQAIAVREDSETLLNHAFVLARTGNLQEAGHALQKAIRSNPRSVQAYVSYGRILRAAGNLTEAKKQIQRAAELAPNDPSVLAELKYLSGDGVVSSSQDPKGFASRAMHFARSEDFARAHAELQTGHSKFPKSWELWLVQGNVKRMAADIDGAKAAYEKAVEFDNRSTPEPRSSLGAVLSRENPEAAVKLLLEAIDIDPTFAEAHNNLANTYARVQRFDDAIRHYELALKYKPNFSTASQNLAAVRKMKLRTQP